MSAMLRKLDQALAQLDVTERRLRLALCDAEIMRTKLQDCRAEIDRTEADAPVGGSS